MPWKASSSGTHICFPVTCHFKGKHVPSFKNSKMLTRGKLITKPEYQRVMKEITRALVSSLRCAIQTAGDATLTEPFHACSTVSLEQLRKFDDSNQWIRLIRVEAVDVPKGEEGFILSVGLHGKGNG